MNDIRPSEGEQLPLVEHFFTLQGEGYHTGKAAYFIRLGGCDVGCRWCDTRFSWDPGLHPLVETDRIVGYAVDSGSKAVVVTGGEPLMWNLDHLCNELKKHGISTFLETSGAYPVTGEWDWICLSPKKNMPPGEDVLTLAGELKVIIETEEDFDWAETCRRKVSKECKLYLQPEWSRFKDIIGEVVDYVKMNPAWSVSLQSHKYMKIP